MIQQDDLATLHIHRLIFHDVPKRVRGLEAAPVLSEVEATLDTDRIAHLKRRLVRVLSSKSAYDIQFRPETQSPVPELIRLYTKGKQNSEDFVKMSQSFAQYLFEQQGGSSSPGVLAVMDTTVMNKRGLVVLKLEREEGAQLELSEKKGKQTFEMSVLDNLVLTEGTRLFKAALFVRTGPAGDDFSSGACDSQRPFGSTDELAQFWLRFLGCKLIEDPRVSTKKFFEAALTYVNVSITDPIEKTKVYDHVMSEMSSEKKTFSPKTFIEEYVPKAHRESFENFLKEQQVSLKQFHLDTSEIAGRIRRRSYHTAKGVEVRVPVPGTPVPGFLIPCLRHCFYIRRSARETLRRNPEKPPEWPKLFQPRKGRHLSEGFHRIKRDPGFPQYRFKFFFIRTLSMMLRLMLDVMFHRVTIGTANAECAVSLLPCELDSAFA